MRSFEYGEQGNPDVFGDSNYDIGPDIGVAIESPTCPSEVYLFLYFSLLVALVSSAFW
jgi:hypothetical protein